MKMYLISDNLDTYAGMRLAGVEGVVLHSTDEMKEARHTGIITGLPEAYWLIMR